MGQLSLYWRKRASARTRHGARGVDETPCEAWPDILGSDCHYPSSIDDPTADSIGSSNRYVADVVGSGPEEVAVPLLARVSDQAAAVVAVGQRRADDLGGPAPALGLLERHKIDLTATSTRRDGEVIFKPNYRGRGDPFHLNGAAQVARVAADEQTDQQRYDG